MKQQGNFLLFTREEFRDWLLEKEFKREIKVIQEHHTWSPNYKNFIGNNHFSIVKSMKNYHVNTVKMSNIAQNITTFPDGLIMICRPIDIAPAGIKGCNTNGICIEHMGNFDIGGDVVSEEHKKTIIFVTAVLCIKFNLTPSVDSITYHHWWDLDKGVRTNGSGTTKSCPGSNWFGGNSVDCANKNFIPLIITEINNIKKPKEVVKMDAKPFEQITGEKAIDLLVQKGLIKSPDVWKTKDLKNEPVPLWLFFEMLNRITK